ncbi:hypothetical protein NQ315_004113, partial [Exocentrus adspersus]
MVQFCNLRTKYVLERLVLQSILVEECGDALKSLACRERDVLAWVPGHNSKEQEVSQHISDQGSS